MVNDLSYDIKMFGVGFSVGAAIGLLIGIAIGKDSALALKQEAVKAKVARYIADDSGNAKFEWVTK